MPTPLSSLVLGLLATIIACVLVLDANWMVAILRNGPRTARPPIFKAPIRIEGGWRRTGYLALGILVIVPLFMLPFMGVWPLLTSSIAGGILAGLVAVVALAIVAKITGRPLMEGVTATAISILLVAPYLMAGPVGWTRYLIVIGMMSAITALLFVVALIHKGVFGYRPVSRLGAGLRLVGDGSLAAAVMIAGFWSRFS